jgi:hypothetical protein
MNPLDKTGDGASHKLCMDDGKKRFTAMLRNPNGVGGVLKVAALAVAALDLEEVLLAGPGVFNRSENCGAYYHREGNESDHETEHREKLLGWTVPMDDSDCWAQTEPEIET